MTHPSFLNDIRRFADPVDEFFLRESYEHVTRVEGGGTRVHQSRLDSSAPCVCVGVCVLCVEGGRGVSLCVQQGLFKGV